VARVSKDAINQARPSGRLFVLKLSSYVLLELLIPNSLMGSHVGLGLFRVDEGIGV
jgi:hypothetical protein